MNFKILTKEGDKTIEGLWVSNILSTSGDYIREGDTLLVKEYKNDSHELYEEKRGRPYYKKDGNPQDDSWDVTHSFTKDDVRGKFLRQYTAKVFIDEGTSLSIEVIKSGKSAKGAYKESVGTVFGLMESMNTGDLHPVYDFTIIKRKKV